jgi:uncharacterized sulfatase
MYRESKSAGIALAFALAITCAIVSDLSATERPNILIAISDDQSYPHASAYGYEAISTPAFDRVAKEGILFRNAFTPAPGCSPMRAAFLTGRNIWQIEQAGTHASSFPAKYEVFPDRLEQAGYWVGYTGKGWAPGNWKISGRERNPAGPQFSKRKMEAPRGISNTDYASNFADFLAERPAGQPFCFWYGGYEPHRSFGKGLGRENGLDPGKVQVPAFLPDTEEIRDDILDYCFEIQWFDQHLDRMLRALDEAGELDNTLVIVTSDNGMAFPRAKANVYEYGIHMPLAIACAGRLPGGRIVDDLVNLTDVTSTIYEAAGVAPPAEYPPAGRSMLDLLLKNEQGIVDASRDAVFSGRERHSSSRYLTLSYPQRCIRTHQYLYIRNFKPRRWPAGAPQKYGKGGYAKNQEVIDQVLGDPHGGYHDIDACPTLSYLIQHRQDPSIERFFHLAVDRRPSEELFDIVKDPACLENLADDPNYAQLRAELSGRLTEYLTRTGDARVLDDDGGDIWETYPRYSGLRWFPTPDWAQESPDAVPRLDWLEERRPR